MTSSYARFIDSTGRTVYINPSLVRCITGQPEGRVRVEFDETHVVLLDADAGFVVAAILEAAHGRPV